MQQYANGSLAGIWSVGTARRAVLKLSRLSPKRLGRADALALTHAVFPHWVIADRTV
jgi:hypothetical protein